MHCASSWELKVAVLCRVVFSPQTVEESDSCHIQASFSGPLFTKFGCLSPKWRARNTSAERYACMCVYAAYLAAPVRVIIRADGDLCWNVLASQPSLSSSLQVCSCVQAQRECERKSVRASMRTGSVSQQTGVWRCLIPGCFLVKKPSEVLLYWTCVAWLTAVEAALTWLWSEVRPVVLGCLCRSCCARVRRLLSGLWRGSRSFCRTWRSHCCREPATARTHARAPWWRVTVRVCVCVSVRGERMA